MNKISSAFSAEGQPFQSPLHLDFLQNANKEAVSNAIIGMIGDTYSPTTWYRLFGCELTNTGGDSFTNTAGAVFYGGEVYTVDAVGGSGTLMDGGIKMVVSEVAGGSTTMASGATRSLNLTRKAIFANDPAGSQLWRPTEIRISSKYTDGGLSNTLTITTECSNYYVLLATTTGNVTITIDHTNRVVGGTAVILLSPSTSNDIVISTTSAYIVVGPTTVTGNTRICIEYIDTDAYIVSIITA